MQTELLFILWLANVGFYATSIQFNYSIKLGSDSVYSVDWSIVDGVDSGGNTIIVVRVGINLAKLRTNSNLKYFGIGFGPDDCPVGADLFLVRLDRQDLSRGNFAEAYTDLNGRIHMRRNHFKNSPVKAFSIDASVLNSNNIDAMDMDYGNLIYRDKPMLYFTFARNAISCLKYGYTIDNQTTRIFLFHDYYHQLFNSPFEADNWQLHFRKQLLEQTNMASIHYKLVRLQMIKSRNAQKLEFTEDVQTFAITVENVIIPANGTTYWCKLEKLPTFRNKHHIIGYETVISPSSIGKIHHIEVFRCLDKSRISDYDGPCNSEMKPMSLRHCRNVIGAWAVGSAGNNMPKQAGIPIGGKNEVEYAVIEIHYMNPNKENGPIDNSGLRFFVTPKLRQFDAGIMELGLAYTPGNALPPGQKHVSVLGYCNSQCTNITFPQSGITVFASQLHTHHDGVKVVTYHVRNQLKLPDLNRDNHYSPDFQEIRLLDEPVNVQAGDSLITKCTYNTEHEKTMRVGGIGHENQMCLNYIFYYPKIDLELCKSEVSLNSLNLFLHMLEGNDLSIDNSINNENVENAFNSIKWTSKNVNYLNRFYSLAPIVMHCNNSRGQRIRESEKYSLPVNIQPRLPKSLEHPCPTNTLENSYLT